MQSAANCASGSHVLQISLSADGLRKHHSSNCCGFAQKLQDYVRKLVASSARSWIACMRIILGVAVRIAIVWNVLYLTGWA